MVLKKEQREKTLNRCQGLNELACLMFQEQINQSEKRHIYSKGKRNREDNTKNSIKIIKNTMSRG